MHTHIHRGWPESLSAHVSARSAHANTHTQRPALIPAICTTACCCATGVRVRMGAWDQPQTRHGHPHPGVRRPHDELHQLHGTCRRRCPWRITVPYGMPPAYMPDTHTRNNIRTLPCNIYAHAGLAMLAPRWPRLRPRLSRLSDSLRVPACTLFGWASRKTRARCPTWARQSATNSTRRSASSTPPCPTSAVSCASPRVIAAVMRRSHATAVCA